MNLSYNANLAWYLGHLFLKRLSAKNLPVPEDFFTDFKKLHDYFEERVEWTAPRSKKVT